MFTEIKVCLATGLLAVASMGAQAATVTPVTSGSTVASSQVAFVNVVLPTKPPSRTIPRAPRVVPSPS